MQPTKSVRTKHAKPKERRPEAAARRGDMDLKIGKGKEWLPWVN